MSQSKHFRKRMSQRGIRQTMVDLTLEYGLVDQDRYVLTKTSAQELKVMLEAQVRVLKKLIDKGGLVVVEADNTQITTYNYGSYKK